MKVLLALDGSAHARGALEYLSGFPFVDPPDLMLVNVCPVADLHVIGPDVPVSVNALVDQCRAEGDRLLDEAVPLCQPWARSVEKRLVDGHPAHEIVTLAEKEQSELVVVGARGLTAVQRFFLGSVSEKVVKYSHCSVLLVRGDDSGNPRPLQRILLADDGSETSQQAVQRFANFPLGAARHVTLLNVVEQFHGYGLEFGLEFEEYQKGLLDSGRQLLAEREKLIRSCGAVIAAQVHQSPNIADDIVETAREDQTDLIVIGGTGKSGWERILLGSVSSRVLHHAPCSVWVERARENDA